VPVRGIADGKSRLAAVLEPAARARHNRKPLATTVAALGRWRGDLGRCVVVSPCQEALEMAARLGAATVLETPGSDGLNAAAALGAAYAGSKGARSVLVLPCDLPYLSADALAALVDTAEAAPHMVIAPDRLGTGTNALLVSVQRPFEFRFGERSFERHLLLAAERGWRTSLCQRPELEFDLDTPEDLAAWHGRAEMATKSAQLK
jgi:2-phospho-L-lactate guanylyltransferase